MEVNMRAKNTFLIFLLFPAISFAITDSVFVNLNGDTVQIWNTGVSDNCGSKFTFDINIVSDTITVTERDTSTQYAYCTCYFDLSVSLTDLATGNYLVNVYRIHELIHDTLYFIGSSSFRIEGNGNVPFIMNKYQSLCLQGPTIVAPRQNEAAEYSITNNYPNPFNYSTNIHYMLPISGQVTLKLYNLLGQEITTIINEQKAAGSYEVSVNMDKFSSGVYFYRLICNRKIMTGRMILIK